MQVGRHFYTQYCIANFFSYKGTTVLGIDLWNEPKPPDAAWGWGVPAQDWHLAAQAAGNAILSSNPQWLIFVAGLGTNGWAGSDLTYVRNNSITLSLPNQLVYSTHELSQDSFNQTWFNAPGYPANLRGLWRSRWGYIVEQGLTPVFLGSFGTYFTNPTKDIPWMTQLVNYMNGQYTSDGVNQLLPGQKGMSWAIGLQYIGILFGDFKTVDTLSLPYLRKSFGPLLTGPLPSAQPTLIPTRRPTAIPSTRSPTLPQPTYTTTFRPTNVLAGSKYFEKYFADGNQIVDESGNPIRMTGVNWYGDLLCVHSE